MRGRNEGSEVSRPGKRDVPNGNVFAQRLLHLGERGRKREPYKECEEGKEMFSLHNWHLTNTSGVIKLPVTLLLIS